MTIASLVHSYVLACKQEQGRAGQNKAGQGRAALGAVVIVIMIELLEQSMLDHTTCYCYLTYYVWRPSQVHGLE